MSKAHALTIPIALGTDPEIIEIDDASEAIGEIDPDTFDTDLDYCDLSPNGQHEYEAITGHRFCKHCRETTDQ